ncbi:MAG: hypothetical protein ACOC23_04545 [Thermodesulfobacteriota bacterium]
MNSKQSLWILSSMMTVILCGIGVLLMLDFDTTIRRIVKEEVSIKTLNPEESMAEAAKAGEIPKPADSKTTSETESSDLEKESEGMNINPTPAVLNETADDKPHPPKSDKKSKHQTAAIAPQLAQLASDGPEAQK